ncbi:hypothetical protein BD779DRAFT_520772 [Infundibulicybe gibba]|nr:hypothetical protein BD779DRAFT_520772 [Infundibulicybe gibba]
MIRKKSMIRCGDNSGTGFGNSTSDAASFWVKTLSSRLSHLGTAPPPEQHSSATTSSIEALDEKERVLQGIIDPIWSRYYDEERALESILEGFREHRGRQEHTVGSLLATIRHYRNGLVSITRLPPEILTGIFIFSVQMVRPKDWIGTSRTISHVCKRWREIALDCPKLWSHIDLEHDPRWLERIIERSRSVPLLLLGGNEVEMVREPTALVANNMHRFESIDMCIADSEEHDAYLPEIFSQPILALRHLTFTSYHNHSLYAFPHDFLGGWAPNLRHIKLETESAHVPWNSGLFTNLTTLEVYGAWYDECSVVPRGFSSFRMLLDALVKMPGLEHLVLRHCIPPAYTMTEYIDVDLPNLERLELAGPLNSCANLLTQITINASATLDLDFQGFRELTLWDVRIPGCRAL